MLNGISHILKRLIDNAYTLMMTIKLWQELLYDAYANIEPNEIHRILVLKFLKVQTSEAYRRLGIC